MSTLLRVQPDATYTVSISTGTFEHDADVPEAHVVERIYPEARDAWLRAMELQGYTLLPTPVYFSPRRFAVIETNDDGTAHGADYEHDETQRQKVRRKMAAYFYRRDLYTGGRQW